MLSNYILYISLLVLSPFAQDLIKIVAGAVFGSFGVAVYNKVTSKRKEKLEIANLTSDGANLVVQLRTNIDKLVADRTADLNKQISELQNTIITTSTKYAKDLDVYITKMAGLEQRMDQQSERTEKAEIRNNELEQNLEVEINLRKACIRQLKNLQERVYELEKLTSPPTDKSTNNPDDPKNSLSIDDLRF